MIYPSKMMFTDDVAMINNEKRWRNAPAKRGLKVRRSKMEYLCNNQKANLSLTKIVDDRPEVGDFKYLESKVQSDGGSDRERT